MHGACGSFLSCFLRILWKPCTAWQMEISGSSWKRLRSCFADIPMCVSQQAHHVVQVDKLLQRQILVADPVGLLQQASGIRNHNRLTRSKASHAE